MSTATRLLVVVYHLIIAFLLAVLIMSVTWEYGTKRALIPFNKLEQDFEISFFIGLSSYEIRGAGHDKLQDKDVEFIKTFVWRDDPLEGNVGEKDKSLKQYMETVKEGFPLPVVWIQEYLMLNSEGVQHTRHYRTAGFYGHLLLTLAMMIWITSFFISFGMVAMYAKWVAMTGLMMLGSSTIFMLNRNSYSEIRVPLYGPDTKDVHLELGYGYPFYLSMYLGAFIAICGVVLNSLVKQKQTQINQFFNVKTSVLYTVEKKAIRGAKEEDDSRKLKKKEPQTEHKADTAEVELDDEQEWEKAPPVAMAAASPEDVLYEPEESVPQPSEQPELVDQIMPQPSSPVPRRYSVELNVPSIKFDLIEDEPEDELPPPPPPPPLKEKKKHHKKEEDEPMCGWCGLMWC